MGLRLQSTSRTTLQSRILVICGFFLALSSFAWGRDLRVHTTASLMAALLSTQPGDRILVAHGRYSMDSPLLLQGISGTPEHPIEIISTDGPRKAVLEFSNQQGLIFSNSAYVHFVGLAIESAAVPGITIQNDSHHIELSGLVLQTASSSAGPFLSIENSQNIALEDSQWILTPLSDTTQEGSYLCFTNSDHVTLKGNSLRGGPGKILEIRDGSEDIVVRENLFLSVPHSGTNGAGEALISLGGWTHPEGVETNRYEITHLQFLNNVLLGGTQGALAIRDTNDAVIHGNLILNSDRVIVEFRAGRGSLGRSNNIQFTENQYVDTRGKMPAVYLKSSHGLTGFYALHNIYWNNKQPLPQGGLVDVSLEPPPGPHGPAIPQIPHWNTRWSPEVLYSAFKQYLVTTEKAQRSR